MIGWFFRIPFWIAGASKEEKLANWLFETDRDCTFWFWIKCAAKAVSYSQMPYATFSISLCFYYEKSKCHLFGHFSPVRESKILIIATSATNLSMAITQRSFAFDRQHIFRSFHSFFPPTNQPYIQPLNHNQ